MTDTTTTETAEYEAMDAFGQVEYNLARELGLSHRDAMLQSGYGDEPVPMVLLLTDIERALADPRHHGWGYACRRSLSKRAQHTANAVVLRAANEQDWNYDQLFEWCDSKSGRHFCDMVSNGQGGYDDPFRPWTQKALFDWATTYHYLDEVLPGS